MSSLHLLIPDKEEAQKVKERLVNKGSHSEPLSIACTMYSNRTQLGNAYEHLARPRATLDSTNVRRT